MRQALLIIQQRRHIENDASINFIVALLIIVILYIRNTVTRLFWNMRILKKKHIDWRSNAKLLYYVLNFIIWSRWVPQCKKCTNITDFRWCKIMQWTASPYDWIHFHTSCFQKTVDFLKISKIVFFL